MYISVDLKSIKRQKCAYWERRKMSNFFFFWGGGWGGAFFGDQERAPDTCTCSDTSPIMALPDSNQINHFTHTYSQMPRGSKTPDGVREVGRMEGVERHRQMEAVMLLLTTGPWRSGPSSVSLCCQRELTFWAFCSLSFDNLWSVQTDETRPEVCEQHHRTTGGLQPRLRPWHDDIWVQHKNPSKDFWEKETFY